MPAQEELNVGLSVTPNFSATEQALSRFEKTHSLNLNINTQPLGRITGNVDEFSKSMAAANARVIAFGASAGIISVVAESMANMVRQSIDVEKKLTDINTILRANSSGLQQFGDALFKIASNTGTTFDEVAEAAKSLARQGLSAQETLKRTNDALILTRLSGLGAAESVEVLTATMNTFSKEALSTTDIINRLANTDAHFAVTAGDLAEALQRTGTVAQAAKVSFNELVSIVAAVEQQTGRSGTFISNALNSIFTRLDRTDTLDKLSQLGVAVRDVSGATLPALSILSQLAEKFGSLSEAQKVSVSQSIAGVRQTTILNSLLTDLGGRYSLTRSALENLNGTTDQAITRNEALNRTISAMANQSLANFTKMSAAAGKLVFGPSLETIFGSFNDASKLLDGNKLGNKIGEGLLKGIGSALSGPGIVVGGFLAAKLFIGFAKFAADSTQRVLGIAQASEKQKAVQAQINELIQQNADVYRQIAAEGGKIQDAEAKTLEIIQKRVIAAKELDALSKSVGANLFTSGQVTISPTTNELVPTKKAYAGFVPNLVNRDSISTEVEGARRAGYSISPSQVRSMSTRINGRTSEIVYNDREKVIPNFAGTGEPAIVPPNRTIQDLIRNKNHAAAGFNPMKADYLTQKKLIEGEARRLGVSTNEIAELYPNFFQSLTEEHRVGFPRNSKERQNRNAGAYQSMVDKYGFSSGYVPNLEDEGVSFTNRELGKYDTYNQYRRKTYAGKVPVINIWDRAFVASDVRGFGIRPEIAVANHHLRKGFDGKMHSTLNKILEYYFSKERLGGKGVTLAISPGTLIGLNPTEQESIRVMGGDYYEEILKNTFGIKLKADGVDIPAHEFNIIRPKLLSMGVPKRAIEHIIDAEAKKGVFNSDKLDEETGPGPVSFLEGAVRDNPSKYLPQILNILHPQMFDYLKASRPTLANQLNEDYGGHFFAGGHIPNFVNPFSLRAAGISRKEQKIIGGLLSGFGAEGLINSAELLSSGNEEQKARIIKNYSSHSAFEGLGLSEQEKGQILDKAFKTVHILKNGIKYPNMGRAGSVLKSFSGGHLPEQIGANEAISNGLANMIPGLGEAIHRETSGTGVSLNEARVNFLNSKSGLPPVSVTNVRDEGADASPLKGFARVRGRGGRPELAGSGREYLSSGFIPNFIDDETFRRLADNEAPKNDKERELLADINRTIPPTDKLEKLLNELSGLTEERVNVTKSTLEKEKEEKNIVTERVEKTKQASRNSPLGITGTPLEKQINKQAERENASNRLQKLGFLGAFAIPAIGGIASEFVKNPGYSRDTSGVTNAIGTGASIASVLPSGAGAAIGGLVALFGSLKTVINNLVPSFDDLQKKTDELVSKQSEQNNAIQASLEADARYKEAVEGGNSRTIRLTEESRKAAFSSIKDKTLRDTLSNAPENSSVREEAIAKLNAEQGRAKAKSDINATIQAILEKREGVLGISGSALSKFARSGFGQYFGIDESELNHKNLRGHRLSEDDIQGVVGTSLQAGIGEHLLGPDRERLSKIISGINPNAIGADASVRNVATQIGFSKQTSEFITGFRTPDSIRIIQEFLKALADPTVTQGAKQTEALVDNLKQFTIQLVLANTAFDSLNARKEAKNEGDINSSFTQLDYINKQRAQFGNLGSNAIDEYQQSILNAQKDYSTENLNVSKDARKSLREFNPDLLYPGDPPTISQLRAAVGGGSTGSDPLGAISQIKKILYDKVNPPVGQLPKGGSGEVEEGDAGNNGQGTTELNKITELLAGLNSRMDVATDKFNQSKEIAQKILDLERDTIKRDRAAETFGGSNLLNGDGFDNTQSITGIQTSFQQSLREDNPEFQQLERFSRLAFNGGGALGRSQFDVQRQQQLSSEAGPIGRGIRDDFQNGIRPTGTDLSIAAGLPGGENSSQYRAFASAHDLGVKQLTDENKIRRISAINGEAQGVVGSLISSLNSSRAFAFAGQDPTEIFRAIQSSANSGDLGQTQKLLSNLRGPTSATRDIITQASGIISELNSQKGYNDLAAETQAKKDAGDSDLIDNTKAIRDSTQALLALKNLSEGKNLDGSKISDGKGGPLEAFNSSASTLAIGTKSLGDTIGTITKDFNGLKDVLGTLVNLPKKGVTNYGQPEDDDSKGGSHARGYIPSLLKEQDAIRRGVGGARSTDTPIVRNIQGLGLSVINSGEKVVENYIPGKAAILNRDQQASFAFGHVPNFAANDFFKTRYGRSILRRVLRSQNVPDKEIDKIIKEEKFPNFSKLSQAEQRIKGYTASYDESTNTIALNENALRSLEAYSRPFGETTISAALADRKAGYVTEHIKDIAHEIVHFGQSKASQHKFGKALQSDAGIERSVKASVDARIKLSHAAAIRQAKESLTDVERAKYKAPKLKEYYDNLDPSTIAKWEAEERQAYIIEKTIPTSRVGLFSQEAAAAVKNTLGVLPRGVSYGYDTAKNTAGAIREGLGKYTSSVNEISESVGIGRSEVIANDIGRLALRGAGAVSSKFDDISRAIYFSGNGAKASSLLNAGGKLLHGAAFVGNVVGVAQDAYGIYSSLNNKNAHPGDVTAGVIGGGIRTATDAASFLGPVGQSINATIFAASLLGTGVDRGIGALTGNSDYSNASFSTNSIADVIEAGIRGYSQLSDARRTAVQGVHVPSFLGALFGQNAYGDAENYNPSNDPTYNSPLRIAIRARNAKIKQDELNRTENKKLQDSKDIDSFINNILSHHSPFSIIPHDSAFSIIPKISPSYQKPTARESYLPDSKFSKDPFFYPTFDKDTNLSINTFSNTGYKNNLTGIVAKNGTSLTQSLDDPSSILRTGKLGPKHFTDNSADTYSNDLSKIKDPRINFPELDLDARVTIGGFVGSRRGYLQYIKEQSEIATNPHTNGGVSSLSSHIIDSPLNTAAHEAAAQAAVNSVRNYRSPIVAEQTPQQIRESYARNVAQREAPVSQIINDRRNDYIIPSDDGYIIPDDDGYRIPTNYASGYDPITDAVHRETIALRRRGIYDQNAVYLDHDSRVGMAVGNRYDEPFGVSSGVSRVIAQGSNPHMAGMPNFATNDNTGNNAAIAQLHAVVTSLHSAVQAMAQTKTADNKHDAAQSQQGASHEAKGHISVDANVRVSGNDASGVGAKIADEIKKRLAIVESQVKQIASEKKVVFPPTRNNN